MVSVWKHSKSRLSDRLVLLALADHADDSGKCWPGVESLSIKANLSERQCQRCLRNLEVAGEIKTDPQGGPHGTNLFRITLTAREEQIVTPDKSGNEGVTNPTKERPDLSPEPSFKSSIETSEPLTPSPKGKGKNMPKPLEDEAEIIQILSKIFDRTTPWRHDDIRRLRRAMPTLADAKRIEALYAQPGERRFCPQKLPTLLSGWGGMLDVLNGREKERNRL